MFFQNKFVSSNILNQEPKVLGETQVALTSSLWIAPNNNTIHAKGGWSYVLTVPIRIPL